MKSFCDRLLFVYITRLSLSHVRRHDTPRVGPERHSQIDNAPCYDLAQVSILRAYRTSFNVLVSILQFVRVQHPLD